MMSLHVERDSSTSQEGASHNMDDEVNFLLVGEMLEIISSLTMALRML